METDAARLAELFATALELASSEARAAYLQEACGDDRILLARVEKLLAAHDTAGEFLDEHPPEDRLARPPLDALQPVSSDLQPGDWVGRYRILELVGEGGFSAVYLAEQEEPLRRRVALKIIKQGMDTRQIVARFEGERQALASMDHPHIAKVFEAGATANGRLYFVMEWVEGLSLTDHCDRQRLSVRERLDLFIAVCQAVEHAHQKGIIHRDLKPSNILVALQEGKPVPKVIDFGIAKSIEGRLTAKTLVTCAGQMLGTPLYMSPEQAQMDGTDVDTRADVYSLGVVLYELLTGHQPIGWQVLDEVPYDEVLRMIRTQDPPRPSTRVRTLSDEERATVALQRQSNRVTLPRSLRGDLDWIVMRSLEKDRNRRYGSAAALAEDLRSHLEHQPVSAAAPSAGYRLGKFARRNRLGFVATGLVTAALLSGTGVSLWQGSVARRNAREAELRRVEAENALADVYLARGLAASARQEHGSALQWFAAAARAGERDPDRVLANAMRGRVWAQHTALPVRAFRIEDPPTHLNFSVDGVHLVANTDGNGLHVWDWRAEQARSWTGALEPAVAVALNPAGSELALALPSGHVEIRNLKEGLVRDRFVLPMNRSDMEGGAPRRPDFIPGARGARPSNGGSRSEFAIDRLSSGLPMNPGPEELKERTPSPSRNPVQALAFSPDGRYLAVAGRDVWLWDCLTHAFLPLRLEHPEPVWAVCFAPRLDRLATACLDGYARVFGFGKPPPADGSPFPAVSPLFPPVPHVADPLTRKPDGGSESRTVLGRLAAPVFAWRGLVLLTKPAPNQITRWDVVSGVPKLHLYGIGSHSPIAVDRQLGHNCASGLAASDAWLWTRLEMPAPGVRLPHDGGVLDLTFSHSGEMLLTADADGMAKLWRVPDGQAVCAPMEHSREVVAAVFCPGDRFIATAQADGLIRVWRLPLAGRGDRHLCHQPGPKNVRLSHNGRYVVATPPASAYTYLDHLCVYDVTTGEPLGPPVRIPNQIADAVLSPNGTRLATARLASAGVDATPTGLIEFWDSATAQQLLPAVEFPGRPVSMDWCLLGEKVAVMGEQGELALIEANVAGRRHLLAPAGEGSDDDPGSLVRFTSDGLNLIALGPDGVIEVREAVAGGLRFALGEPGSPHFAYFALSEDARYIAALASDGTVQVWDVQSGEAAGPPLLHSAQVSSARFDPGGSRLLTAGRDHLARLWDWRTGKQLCPPMRHPAEVRGLGFTRSGAQALTCSEDGMVRFWDCVGGRSMAPTWAVGQCAYNIEVSPDGQAAVIGSDAADLPILDLEPFSRSRGSNPGDLELLGEVATGYEIVAGEQSRLSTEQWWDRYRALRSADPGDLDGELALADSPEGIRAKAPADHAPVHTLLPGTEPGLLAYWRFDEGRGTTVHDGTTNRCDGILNHALTGWREWRAGDAGEDPFAVRPGQGPVWVAHGEGHALSFDGEDDRVAVGKFPWQLSAFTVEAWARKTRNGVCQIILSHGMADWSKGLALGFANKDYFYFGFYSDDLNTANCYTDFDWHHWAGTYDSVTRLRCLYRDGELVASDTARNNYLGTGSMIMGDFTWGGAAFQGDIDEVRIWNVVRTQAEIRASARRFGNP